MKIRIFFAGTSKLDCLYTFEFGKRQDSSINLKDYENVLLFSKNFEKKKIMIFFCILFITDGIYIWYG